MATYRDDSTERFASDDDFLNYMNQEAMYAFARPATDAELDAAMNAHGNQEDSAKYICPDCRKIIRNGCGHSESCDYGATAEDEMNTDPTQDAIDTQAPAYPSDAILATYHAAMQTYYAILDGEMAGDVIDALTFADTLFEDYDRALRAEFEA